MKFRHKQTVIEAEQFTGDTDLKGVCTCNGSPAHIHTMHQGKDEGQTLAVMPGDWVAYDWMQETHFPISGDKMAALYEQVYDSEPVTKPEPKAKRRKA